MTLATGKRIGPFEGLARFKVYDIGHIGAVVNSRPEA